MLAYWGGPHGGPWFLLFPLFWFTVIVVAIFLFRRGRPGWRSASAEVMLGELFARGEISEEEYRKRREVLRRKS